MYKEESSCARTASSASQASEPSPSGDRPSTFIERKNYLVNPGELFARNPTCLERPGCRIRNEISPNFGKGFAEVLKLHSGLNVAFCDYYFEDALRVEMRGGVHDSLRFFFLLKGTYKRNHPDGTFSETLGPGDIWLVQGQERAVAIQPARAVYKGMYIEMPRPIMEAWLEGAACDKQLLEKMMEGLQNTRPCETKRIKSIARSIARSHPVVQMANSLYSFRRNTMYEQLRFEALSIDILAEFLNINTSRHYCRRGDSSLRRKAVGDALDILDEEWEVPPTIGELSRRVGVNECYLKKDFRDETGLSIGGYVRKLRMERARKLIESGQYSILQVSLFVGYSNPSHFSNAFKRFYGRLPSFYASEVRSKKEAPFFIRSGWRA